MTQIRETDPDTPSSVYVHVPFCRHRCGYCNFTLVADRDYLVDDYLKALSLEMSGLDERLSLDTIYLGGGTPSRLDPTAFEKLLKLLDRHFNLNTDYEFTIEANPEDLPGNLAAVIADSPVNRISLGVQSFDPARLQLLDRDHSTAQIERSISFAINTVSSLSLDLIFGTTGDTPDQWQRDLESAIDSGAGHLSTYELTIEKGTQFWNRQQKQESVRVTDDDAAGLYEQTISVLDDAGLQQYEVSSFARPGQRSRHNQVYWSGDSWLALGPGAAGFVNGIRYTNHRSVTRYLREVLAGRPAAQETTQLSAAELALEQIVFGLRRLDGIKIPEWSSRTGFRANQIVAPEIVNSLIEAGLLSVESDTWKLTRAGLLHGDFVCQRIFNAGSTGQS